MPTVLESALVLGRHCRCSTDGAAPKHDRACRGRRWLWRKLMQGLAVRVADRNRSHYADEC